MKIIPPFRLVPEPLDDEAAKLPGFKWAGGDIGKRHQLGGRPQFIQAEDWPACPKCHEEMSFYGQLDSINDDFCLADCGMVYVFVCFSCNETRSIIQSY
jgi:hypothetical protein